MKLKMEEKHEKYEKYEKYEKKSMKVKMEKKHEGMLLSPQFIAQCLSQLFKFKTL